MAQKGKIWLVKMLFFLPEGKTKDFSSWLHLILSID